MSTSEGFIPLDGSAGNAAPVGGRRFRRKLKLVTKKQARRSLKKLGLKMRGGAPTDPVVADAATGAPVAELKAGRRHGGKKTRKHRSASRRVASMFGL